jgi:hypothetical protein
MIKKYQLPSADEWISLAIVRSAGHVKNFNWRSMQVRYDGQSANSDAIIFPSKDQIIGPPVHQTPECDGRSLVVDTSQVLTHAHVRNSKSKT